MRLAVGEGTAMADCILSERIRRLFHWYTRGFFSEAEVVHMVGKACLCWAEQAKARCSEHEVLVDSRDAV